MHLTSTLAIFTLGISLPKVIKVAFIRWSLVQIISYSIESNSLHNFCQFWLYYLLAITLTEFVHWSDINFSNM